MRRVFFFLFLLVPFLAFAQIVESKSFSFPITWDKSTDAVDYYEIQLLGLSDALKTTGNVVSLIVPVSLESDTLIVSVTAWYGGRSSEPVSLEFVPRLLASDINKDGTIETRDLVQYQKKYFETHWRRSWWNID